MMRIYLRILRYLRPYRFALAGSMVCILFFTLLSSASLFSILPFLDVVFYGADKTELTSGAPPARAPHLPAAQSLADARQKVMQKFYGLVLGENQKSTLVRLCGLIILLICGKNLFDYLQAYLMARVEQGVIMDVRNDLYRHLQQLSLSYFNQNRTGNLISRITNDVTLLNNGVSASFVTLIKNPLLIAAYLGMAFFLSWKLTLAALLIAPLSFAVIGSLGSRLRRASRQSQTKMADLTSILHETISGARVVKAFAMEDFEVRNFTRESKSYFQTLLRVTRISRLAGPITESLGAIVGVGILWFGGQQVLAGGALSPAEFLLFLLAVFSVMQPVKELSTVGSRLQEAMAAGERIFSVLDTEPEIVSRPGAVKIAGFEKNIRYENVTFAYEQNPVLQNIDFEVRKGEILAIVGPSGAGKSTLVDLLPRFYDPTEGRVAIDGIDLREIDVKSLRQLMGIVTQETILFHGSVRSNIAYGLRAMPEEKLREAAIAANAHGFIMELPQGYDTLIGERGLKLSGGQRQRLAIARALLKNPPILILDEATSALDSESEMLVQQAIERLMANRTSFVIAHRLSTVLHAHKIIVLDQGRLVQAGAHADLMQQDGIYQKLYRMQFRA
ncbi:MAG: putative multidrug export ATP-binding/permease protein [bacterium]|nr:putative multidrug export ATP-binding/permease protein [bacterium]